MIDVHFVNAKHLDTLQERVRELTTTLAPDFILTDIQYVYTPNEGSPFTCALIFRKSPMFDSFVAQVPLGI